MPRLCQPVVFCLCALGALAGARRVEAFSESGHTKLADAALGRLSTEQRARLRPYQARLEQGALDRAREIHSDVTWADGEQAVALVVAGVGRIRGLEGRISPFLAYELGRLSADVGHIAEPFGLYRGPRVPEYLPAYEAQVERRFAYVDGASRDLTPEQAYRAALDTAWRTAATRQSTIRADASRGFPSSSESVRMTGEVAAEVVNLVATVWDAAMQRGPSLERSDAIRLSLDQVAFGAQSREWDEASVGLERLAGMGMRVPLSAASVSSAFFDAQPKGENCAVYELAARVDPRSPRIRALVNSCEGQPTTSRVSETSSDPGDASELSSAESTGIRAFRHRRGHVHLTNRETTLGADFVPLNFTPIPKFQHTASPGTSAELEEIVQHYARTYGVDSALVKAVIQTESAFDPHVVSRAGARGLMQLMPSTALDMGVEDIFDPAQNVAGGTQYLALLLEMFDGDETLALAAYNAGPGAVTRYGGVPPYEETRNYVPKVLSRRQHYASTHARVALRGETPRPKEDYLPAEPAVEAGVLLVLNNGLTMRGLEAEETEQGVRLQIETGWILVPGRFITQVVRATG